MQHADNLKISNEFSRVFRSKSVVSRVIKLILAFLTVNSLRPYNLYAIQLRGLAVKVARSSRGLMGRRRRWGEEFGTFYA